jgi:predicted transcriptional regulator
MSDASALDLQNLTADIVAAYVSNNKVSGDELASLIGSTYQALSTAGAPPPPAETEAPKPDKAAVRKSISPDYLTSFLDGRRYKSLKRHLTKAGLTPAEYKERYGLPSDYPMVAATYSAQRSALAKTTGLGRKSAATAAEPVPPAPPAKTAKRGRPKAQA